MDNEMKRRAFLAGIVGTLVGTPVAIRLLCNPAETTPIHYFEKELRKYRSLVDVPVTPMKGAATFPLRLSPPIGDEWKYTFFSSSFLPSELSLATRNEPDLFFVREGILHFDRMNNGQVIVTGGDSMCHVIAPSGKEEKQTKSVTLLVENGTLHSAKPKGTIIPENYDWQLLHLLALNMPNQELNVGMNWKGNIGRIKPFVGYSTQYEILGFADVGGHKTVNIVFSGNVPNIATMSGINEQKPEKNAIFSNQHRGNCYFDLETGFLVRQEIEMESLNGGVKGYKGKDDSDSITIKSQFIIQIYT
jgi:hypothetical protein